MKRHTYAWTSKEIGDRLGISTAVYQNSILGARHIAEIRRAGITRIEISMIPRSFDYRNPSQAAEVLGECEKQGVAVAAIHGWVTIPRQFENMEQRKVVMRESLSAIRFAEEAGASIYVAHLGYSDQTKAIVTELLDQTPGFCVKLTTENGKNLQNYMAVVDHVGSERFGMIVDIGHTRDSDGVNPFVKKDKARQTLAQCGDRIFHIHLHETYDQERKADHWPPLHSKGIVEWGEIFAALRDIDYRGELVFEDGRGENPAEWVRMTADFPRAFVRRYKV